jgi:hypothetical protein
MNREVVRLDLLVQEDVAAVAGSKVKGSRWTSAKRTVDMTTM